MLVLPAGSESHSLNENDKFTRKGWLPSTSKGSALRASGPQGTAPLSVGPAEPTTRHRPSADLLSQNVWARGLEMCVFKSFLGQFSNHQPKIPSVVLPEQRSFDGVIGRKDIEGEEMQTQLKGMHSSLAPQE